MVGLLASLGAVPRRQGGAETTTGEGTTTSSGTLNIVTANAGASELAAVSYSLREHRVLATQVAFVGTGALQMVREGPCGCVSGPAVSAA